MPYVHVLKCLSDFLRRGGVGIADQNWNLTDGIFLIVGTYCGAPVVLLLSHVLHDSVLLTFNCAAIVL